MVFKIRDSTLLQIEIPRNRTGGSALQQPQVRVTHFPKLDVVAIEVVCNQKPSGSQRKGIMASENISR